MKVKKIKTVNGDAETRRYSQVLMRVRAAVEANGHAQPPRRSIPPPPPPPSPPCRSSGRLGGGWCLGSLVSARAQYRLPDRLKPANSSCRRQWQHVSHWPVARIDRTRGAVFLVLLTFEDRYFMEAQYSTRLLLVIHIPWYASFSFCCVLVELGRDAGPTFFTFIG